MDHGRFMLCYFPFPCFVIKINLGERVTMVKQAGKQAVQTIKDKTCLQIFFAAYLNKCTAAYLNMCTYLDPPPMNFLSAILRPLAWISLQWRMNAPLQERNDSNQPNAASNKCSFLAVQSVGVTVFVQVVSIY